MLTDERQFQQPLVAFDVPLRHGKGFVVVAEAVDGEVVVGIVGTGAAVSTEGETLTIGTAAAELTPRLPSSVDPNGIPVRAIPPDVVGDVDVCADDEVMLLEPEPHMPDNPDVSSIPEVVDIPDVAMEPESAPVAGVAVPIIIPPPS